MKTIALLAAVAFTAFASFNPFAAAAPGDLDLNFGSGGKVLTDTGGGGGGRSVALQNDGKIVVAGRGNAGTGNGNDFSVVRYQPNGSLDTSFGGTGKVTTHVASDDDEATSLVVQNDGKIVVAGWSFLGGTSGSDADLALVRYNTDGSLDTSFDGDGKVTTSFGGYADYANSVALQADGKIVVAGQSYNGSKWNIALVRYNANGSLDSTFNGHFRF